jgi:hypothetical protein
LPERRLGEARKVPREQRDRHEQERVEPRSPHEERIQVVRGEHHERRAEHQEHRVVEAGRHVL